MGLVPAALLILSLLSRPALGAPSDDPWFARDKALHFTASAALAGAGYGTAALLTETRWKRAAAGFGTAVVLGAAKEGWDASGRGDPSGRDMTWNVAGAALGTLLSLGVDWLLTPRAVPGSTRVQLHSSPSRAGVVWTVAF